MYTNIDNRFKVGIIGAGPSGTSMASLLAARGIRSIVFEKNSFPRFSIGESLLPQCLEDLSRAQLLEGVEAQKYQYKDGASFLKNGKTISFNFNEKFSLGRGYAFQVKRADFDKNLADQCLNKGIDIRFRQLVEEVDIQPHGVKLLVKDLDCGESKQYNLDFLVDASGFGRVLPRLLNLEKKSELQPRFSLFCHMKDNFSLGFDRNKILIVVHDKRPDVWFWVIPFSDGTSSVGVVGELNLIDESKSKKELLLSFLDQVTGLVDKIDYLNIEWGEVNHIAGYSCSVKNLYGKSFVLLGNAGEFLDPVFSSGVTIALRSASLAAPLIERQLLGEYVNWESEYVNELGIGIEVFRTCVDLWYRGDLMKIFASQDANPSIKAMICSILAGYAWDLSNPMVESCKRRMSALVEWVHLN